MTTRQIDGAGSDWWRQAFPLSRGAPTELLHSATIAIFATGLIWLIRPFGLGQLPTDLANRLIVEIGALCLLFDSLMRSLLPTLWARRYDDSTWSCGADVLRTLLELIALATVIVIWIGMRTPMPWAVQTWLLGILVTVLCAAGPVALRVLLTERQLRGRHQRSLQPGPQARDRAIAPDPGNLCIRADDAELTLAFADFRYARAEQNYVNIIFLKQGVRQQRLLRMTLGELEQQLAQTPVLRSHRSYLVSLPAIRTAEGNAQGYRLRLRDMDDTVPVARSRLVDFRQAWPPA